MVSRLFNFAAACSVTAFCLTAVAWIAAGAVDFRKQFVSLSGGCHFSIDVRGADARLEVFNDSTYGPYRGSIVGLAGGPNAPKVSGFGDVAGICYRLIRRPNARPLWTLSLSLVYPLAVNAVLPAAWLIRRARRARRGFAAEGPAAVV